MSAYELAQLNIASMSAPLESPAMADFVANLDRINSLAEASAGFVWRLIEAVDDASNQSPFGDNTLVNLSVWSDAAALSRFVYQSDHTGIMRRRKQWFAAMPQASLVLWWVRRGQRPSVLDAAAKLQLLRQNGPTEDAFTFRHAFAPPDAAGPRMPFAIRGDSPAA